jgi:hypothetical protein
MSPPDLKERFERHVARSTRTILTIAEQEELKRRSQDHDANKEIMALKDELKGINLSISILKEARDTRLACIKALEASKRSAARSEKKSNCNRMWK